MLRTRRLARVLTGLASKLTKGTLQLRKNCLLLNSVKKQRRNCGTGTVVLDAFQAAAGGLRWEHARHRTFAYLYRVIFQSELGECVGAWSTLSQTTSPTAPQPSSVILAGGGNWVQVTTAVSLYMTIHPVPRAALGPSLCQRYMNRCTHSCKGPLSRCGCWCGAVRPVQLAPGKSQIMWGELSFCSQNFKTGSCVEEIMRSMVAARSPYVHRPVNPLEVTLNRTFSEPVPCHEALFVSE